MNTLERPNTRLENVLSPAVAAHPGLSGIHPLQHGLDAFAARMALAKIARRTLDIQYYIWHRDDTGRLLANELIKAADRGVRVRLLLDDIGTSADDASLLALDHHENIEVRLFNPIANRVFRRLSSLLDFVRLNRRMHNKSFTMDDQIAIIGGRNIGDEYFGFGPVVEFADLDVIAIGPIVQSAKTAFELFWKSPSSVPITSIRRKKISAESVARRRAALAAECNALAGSPYLETARNGRLMTDLERNELVWFWGAAKLVYDLPGKVTASPEDRATHLIPQLAPVINSTQREIVIVSPYFVPGAKGLKFLRAQRKRGLSVFILTNSLAATDVPAVHAGYRRYRKALLRAGVQLYEFKSTAIVKKDARHKKTPGSSRASLHAKTFVFDERNIFVGSLNLDPRSFSLNTEIGAVLEVPELASRAAANIKEHALQNAYRLELEGGSGPVNWISSENGATNRYTCEPGASLGRRLLVALLSLLPIESQL